MSGMIEALHWISLIGALVISLLVFRDLSDVSQFIVKLSRKKVMRTFYNRHKLSIAFLVCLTVAIGTYWLVNAGITWTVFLVSGLSIILAFLGLVNPRLMIRSQHRSANYVPVEAAKEYVRPSESVIVFETANSARAHSDYHMLRPHVASPESSDGNDEVVMTYCGLSNVGIAYQPMIDDQTVDLDVMAQLKNNLVLWDRNSGEPIQQFWGALERTGPSGPRMPEWPCFRMPFWAFEEAFPDGQVYINNFTKFMQNPVYALYDRVVDRMFSDAVKQQEENEAPAFPTIEKFDDRLPNKEKVYAANVGDDFVAYTKSYIQAHTAPLNISLGSKNVVVAYHRKFDSIGMYVNDSNQPVKNIEFGGASDAGKLERLASMKSEVYWVVWQAYFPHTEVNRAPIQN